MKRLSLLLLVLTLISCSEKERNCQDFKTGTFEFTQEINGKKVTSTFTRTETLQIETFNGKTDTASVRWVNDCELVLQKLHPKTMNERKAISMTILATDENSYTFDYSFVGDAKKQRGTVTKLK
ncbi:DNA topoisomerase IV [Flavobacterium buctense]|uniref:DNA topoisomerase IV n=1 Tax=Flavobacterium buctense TaxID=1648146 RepID=A0ABU9DZN3_9FLAO|nr:DNA topoisomerase IV [Flavobacterium buctense]